MDRARSVDWKSEGTESPGDAAAPQRVAGNIYQIVEMTGLDGKKLLKQLPVSKMLGNVGPSIHSPVVLDSTKANASNPDHVSLKTVLSNTRTSLLVKKSSLVTAAPGKLMLQKQMDNVELVKVTSVVNVIPNTTKVSAIQHNYISADKLSLLKDAASISSVNSNVLMNTKSLPVTVNSSELPLGPHLQIPSYAEVKYAPASCLPPPLQQKILAVAPTNASVTSEAAKPPSVIYMSPVKMEKCLQNTSFTHAEKILKPFVQAPVNNSSPDAGTCNSPETQTAPMKWVVQENPQSSGSCLVPVKSSNNMVSKIVKTVVDKNVKSSPASILPACSNSPSESQAELISVKANALLMYNGKVYLLKKAESSTGSAQDNKQVSPSVAQHFSKHASHLTSSFSDDTITNQVVNLVLSKNKGIALGAEDSKCSEPNKNLEVAPVLSKSLHGNVRITRTSQQKAMSTSEHIPVGINVEDKTGTEEMSHKTAAARYSTNHSISKEEAQKTEKINPPGITVQIREKVQHRKPYAEIRKKFGLFEEERVYLWRIPLLNSVTKTDETEHSIKLYKNDSCRLLQGITVNTDHGEEEMILGKPESNIKRKAQLPEPMIENTKRRILGPGLAHENSALVTDNPSSPCRQDVLQEENPTDSSQFPLSGSSDLNPCVQSNEEREVWCPALHSIDNENSFSACSFREGSFLFRPPDLEETIKDEKIERLKLRLKEQEAALEEMRKKMQET